MLFNRMKHDWVSCCTRSSPQAVTTTGTEYTRLAYSNLWFNTVRCKLLFFFFLLCSSKKTKTECCVVYDDDRQRVEEPPTLWYQMLGTRPSMRKCKQHSWWRRTCVWERARYAQRERERERERDRHKETLYSNSNSYKWQPTLTKGYKVTLYSD